MTDFLLKTDIAEIVSHLPIGALEQFAGKHVLMTGARGFLGRYLTRVFDYLNKTHLVGSEVRVTGLDNFVSAGEAGRDVSGFDGEFIRFVEHDVIKPFNPAPRNVGGKVGFPVDYIIHAAGIASPAHYRAKPLETLEVATIGLKNSLELARANPGCKLVFFSSSEIYGDPTEGNVPTPETYKGHVACLGPRACYSDDTEVLTRAGWKFFGRLTTNDEIASLSETRTVEYVKPTEIIAQPFAGELFHFANGKMDLLVTPNHLMIDERNGRQFVEAQADVEWHHRTTPTGGTWPDEEIGDEHKLPPAPRNAKVHFEGVPMAPWLEFVGIYLAEGCVTLTPKRQEIKGKVYEGEQFRVLLAHDHGWKREKILACLQRLPWKFTELDHQFQICNKQLVEALEPFGKKSIEKEIPREYLDLPPSALRILFDGMMLDGSHRDGRAYYTSSEDLADAAQEIALKIGMAASVVRVSAETNPWSDRPGYRVNLRPAVNAHYPEPTRESYDGTVYCVDLPPHRTLFVRRNGKAVLGSNCYDESKRLGETMVQIYAQKFSVHATIIRPFNVYGPGMQHTDFRVLPNFAAKIALGEPLEVYGDGKQTRTYCYVADAIVGFLRVLLHGRPGEPYNIGNPTPEISVLDLHRHAQSVLGRAVEMQIRKHPPEYPADEPSRRCPDISKAARELGYAPRISLEDGLRRFFSWTAETYPKGQPRPALDRMLGLDPFKRAPSI